MKRSNNNKNKGAFKKSGKTGMQLSNNINLSMTSVTIDVNYPVKLFGNSTTDNYTFVSGNDIRYLAFSTVISNTYPFSDLALVFNEYKIHSCTAIVCPISGVQTGVGMLYLSADPEAPTSNPTNSNVIGTVACHVFSPNMIMPKKVKVNFPRGVGSNFNIWNSSITTNIPGAFFIGSNTTSVSLTGDMIFDANFSVKVTFRGMKNF